MLLLDSFYSVSPFFTPLAVFRGELHVVCSLAQSHKSFLSLTGLGLPVCFLYNYAISGPSNFVEWLQAHSAYVFEGALAFVLFGRTLLLPVHLLFASFVVGSA